MVTFFFLLWIILNGRITLELVILGIIVAAAVFLFARKAFGYSVRTEWNVLRYFPLSVVYFLDLILEILKAALAVSLIVLNPARRPDPVLIEFHSGFNSSFKNAVLANSITLTPGTVTVKMEGDLFLVHCLIPEFAQGIEESSFVKLLARVKL